MSDPTPTNLSATFNVHVLKLPRAKCGGCHKRRVLFTMNVGIGTISFDAWTYGLCAGCAGIR